MTPRLLPCLLLADGTAIFDSRVIIEFLQELAGKNSLMPPRGLERYTTLSRAVLADGITDAALLLVYEGRFRDPATFSERWLKHQRGKIARLADHRPAGGAKADAELLGDDLRQRGLAQPRRAEEQHMVHRLPARARGLDEHPQVLPCRRLPDELAERLRAEGGVLVLRLALRGEGGVIGHKPVLQALWMLKQVQHDEFG